MPLVLQRTGENSVSQGGVAKKKGDIPKMTARCVNPVTQDESRRPKVGVEGTKPRDTNRTLSESSSGRSPLSLPLITLRNILATLRALRDHFMYKQTSA